MSMLLRLLAIALTVFFLQACTIVGDRGLLEENQGPGESCAVPVTRTEIDFALDVVPILTNKGCKDCHGATAGVKLEDLPSVVSVGNSTKGPVIIPCDFDASTLFAKISPACDAPFKAKMPLGGDPLTSEEASIIQQWIAEGANATFDPATCAVQQ